MSFQLETCPLSQTEEDLIIVTMTQSMWDKCCYEKMYQNAVVRLVGAYLLDRQRDVFQYAVLHFELIHHWAVGSGRLSADSPSNAFFFSLLTLTPPTLAAEQLHFHFKLNTPLLLCFRKTLSLV